MHQCVQRLLRSTSDGESLECFAELMSIIGKQIDHDEEKVFTVGKHSILFRSVILYLCMHIAPNGEALQESEPHHQGKEGCLTSLV